MVKRQYSPKGVTRLPGRRLIYIAVPNVVYQAIRHYSLHAVPGVRLSISKAANALIIAGLQAKGYKLPADLMGGKFAGQPGSEGGDDAA